VSGARRTTPPGPGAVAVLELCGARTLARLAQLGVSDPPRAGSVRLVRLRRGADDLDEALLVALGPERVELHVHGSPALVRELVAFFGQAPAEPARNVEERAWARLPEAASEPGARVLLDQAEGALRRAVDELRGVPEVDLAPWVERARVLEHLVRPTRVALVGAVNAGKSTLFNALVGAERAVVGEEAGTTRDVLVERAFLGPYPVDLFDTAGERELAGGALAVEVERAGQALARRLVGGVHLVVELAPRGARGPQAGAPAPGARRVLVRTFADRATPGEPRSAGDISVPRDPGAAVARVVELCLAALGLPRDELWVPGRPVPLDTDLATELADAFGWPPGSERDARLDALLGPAPH